MRYEDFLNNKAQLGGNHGFSPIWMPDFLFDFQKALVEWAILKGRAAIFADCGLGKTPMQLVWAENIIRKTGGNVLIVTPLAVSAQTMREAKKFGIKAEASHSGEVHKGVTIINYEKLHLYNPADFKGMVCDESSILKSFNGARKKEITEFMRKLPYRLLATATAAPNDFIELGTSSEALGYLGYMDMLNKFFKNDLNNSASGRYCGEVIKWRLKGHAEIPFWRWVCSWARAIRKPSDLGFNDDAFRLPKLIEQEHVVESETLPDGWLFHVPAIGLDEQREETKRTIRERCEMVAELANNTHKQMLVWCHLNQEGDLLEDLITDSHQVKGSNTDEVKERRLLDFADGKIRVLVTKPKIGAWGLNFQNCSNITFFPSHSYEQYYQGVRRCWRFGQRSDVKVDIVMTEGDKNVMKNLKRKSEQADTMFNNLVAEMNNAISIDQSMAFSKKEEFPSWLLQTN